ncbi:MAG: outer membrane lipoprotein-sorting protein [Acidobacteria bacterium]|nr:outer membrane lipoprotein-sorting protein [Acidobacteriota bacterium]
MKSTAGRDVIGRRLFVTAAAAILGSRAFPVELPQAAALTSRILELRRSAVVRARGRLVVTDARKQQRVFQILVLRKRLGRSVNLLWCVTAPPEARTRILVQEPLEGRPTVWLASGANGTPATLSTESWPKPILRSQLSIDDLVDASLTWPKQAVIGREAAFGKMCYVLRSEPDAQHRSPYASVTTWLDEVTLVPLRIVKKPRGPGAQKEIVCRGVRQSGGHWAASNIEFLIEGAAGSTKIVFTAGSGNARVKDSEVDPKFAFGAGVENP